MFAISGCHALIEYYEEGSDCAKFNVDLVKRIKANNFEYVVIADSYLSFEGVSEELRSKVYLSYSKLIDIIEMSSKKAIFYIDNPYWKIDPLSCVKTKLSLREYLRKNEAFCMANDDSFQNSTKNYFKEVEKLKKKHPKVIFYDSRKILCNNNYCPLFLDDKPLYSDTNHLSLYGSRLAVNPLIELLKQNMPPDNKR